jgi:hypothetical protein
MNCPGTVLESNCQLGHLEDSSSTINSVHCGICLEMTNPLVDCRLDCGHLFHSICICKWILRKNECPLCRAVIQGCDHLANSQVLVDKWEFLLGHGGPVLLECLRDATAENTDLQAQLETVQTEYQLHLDNPIYLLPVYVRSEVVNIPSNLPST